MKPSWGKFVSRITISKGIVGEFKCNLKNIKSFDEHFFADYPNIKANIEELIKKHNVDLLEVYLSNKRMELKVDDVSTKVDKLRAETMAGFASIRAVLENQKSNQNVQANTSSEQA